MEFDKVRVVKLSEAFYNDYPHESFPEVLEKVSRPYSCLSITLNDEYRVYIPYRSHIAHKNGYRFKESRRSKRSSSGLDYAKMIITKNDDYVSNEAAVVDQDEYKETVRNIERISAGAITYIENYVEYVLGNSKMSEKEFKRKYGCSTLGYFIEELGLNINNENE